MDYERLKAIVVAVFAGAAILWGSVGVVFQVLLILMGLDFVTGLLAGWIARELDSGVGWRGLGRKMLTLGVVLTAAAIQPAIPEVAGVGLPLAQVVAGYYAAVEALSVLENAARAGVPVPKVLRDALVKLRDDNASERTPVPTG